MKPLTLIKSYQFLFIPKYIVSGVTAGAVNG
jgi:hypothetical protein